MSGSRLADDHLEMESEVTSSVTGRSDVCLLLLGKTGHGKSASGNSILGRKEFWSAPSTQSVTKCAEVGIQRANKRKLTVVDTPGIGDTSLDTKESTKAAMKAFNTAVALCPDGFHALVLVFKFGQRMTEEERDAIEKLKEMLGQNVIREYAVLLITHGDNFDPEEVQMTFIEWCRSQGGFMKELLHECDNRYVLFDNKTKDVNKLAEQRQELLDCIDRLQSKGKRYNNWMFEQAKKLWMILKRQQEYIEVINEVNAVLGDISSKLLTAQNNADTMDDAYFDSLRAKLLELEDLIKDMEESEKRKLQCQVKDMNDHILLIQKQENDEKRQTELRELGSETETLKQEQKEQIKEYQEHFMKMFYPIIDAMLDGIIPPNSESQGMQKQVNVKEEKSLRESVQKETTPKPKRKSFCLFL